MKHTRSLFVLLLCTIFSISLSAESPKREFRSAWLATVSSIDWPNVKNNATSQKAALDAILDKLVAAKMNAVCFQVRSLCDAMYESSYEPWSSALTGTRGKHSGYDPLAYIVTEAHKRGIEVHAWVNPFRYEPNKGAGSFGSSDSIRKNHADWILTYDNSSFSGTILDPGLPEVRQYTVDVIKEIVQKYDIDGVIFDDYFYPWGGTKSEDQVSQDKYKPADQTVEAWRRANVNATVKGVYDMIQAEKPWVRFGIGPFGIWSTSTDAHDEYGLSYPTGVTGSDTYNLLGCNTVEWMKGGYVDYVAPQLYWSTESTGQSYVTLSKWWSDVAKKYSDELAGEKKVHFFSSQACYRGYGNAEMGLEIDNNRQHDQLGAPGSIFYNVNTFISTGLPAYLASGKYAQRALPPAVDWKATTTLDSVTKLTLSGSTLSWEHASAERFTVYAYTKGTDVATALTASSNLVGVVYGKSLNVRNISGYANKTFAVCAYDRYGNEYAAAFCNVGEASEPEPEPEPETPIDGTLEVTKLWSQTTSTVDYLAVDNSNRSLAYFDNKLYLASKSENGPIHILDATTGKQIDTKYTSIGSWPMLNVRVTSDGQMLFGNTETGKSSFKIYETNCEDLSGSSTLLGTVATNSRCDYFYTHGAWYERGFILALSNTGRVTQIPYENGLLYSDNAVVSSVSVLLNESRSAKAIPAADGKSFYATASSIIPTKHDIATGELLDQFGAGDIPTPQANVGGLAVFTIHGRTYMIVPTDDYGSFEGYDITNGLNKAARVLRVNEPLGSAENGTMTIDFCTAISGDDVYLYVLAPNNGLAAYKLTFMYDATQVETMLSQSVNICSTTEGVKLLFDGEKAIQIYNAQGMLLLHTTARDAYSCTLSQGVYIVRIGDETYKFVK